MCPYVYASWRTDAVVLVSPLRSGAILLVRDLRRIECSVGGGPQHSAPQTRPLRTSPPRPSTQPLCWPCLTELGRDGTAFSSVPLFGRTLHDWDRLLRLCRGTLRGTAGVRPRRTRALSGVGHPDKLPESRKDDLFKSSSILSYLERCEEPCCLNHIL
jgi:hypothetical protein